MSKIIEVRNLRKTYSSNKEEILALEDMTFDVYEGEFLSILGVSGCGKSTLLKIIAGLIPRTSGEVLIDSIPVVEPRDGVAMIFQTTALLPWKNIFENVLASVKLAGLNAKSYEKTAQDLLKLTGLKGFEKRYPFELSGGMQQRVALCRAFITDPKLLLMDEPFGALDALTRERMGYELLRIWSKKKMTMVFVTHSIHEAVFLSDRIIVMTERPGRIAGIIKSELPRPRDWSTEEDPRFSRHVAEAHMMIGLVNLEAVKNFECRA